MKIQSIGNWSFDFIYIDQPYSGILEGLPSDDFTTNCLLPTHFSTIDKSYIDVNLINVYPRYSDPFMGKKFKPLSLRKPGESIGMEEEVILLKRYRVAFTLVDMYNEKIFHCITFIGGSEDLDKVIENEILVDSKLVISEWSW